jgi:hypothetical protein
MTGALACLSITVSAGTVTFATGTTPTLQVNGSMSLVGVTWTSTGAITFNSTTTGQTITTGGTTINAPITFDGVGGGWSLTSALTTGATLTTTLTNGALSLNGFDLTTGIFSSSNTNTRSILFGGNNIILAHTTSAQTVLNMAIATGFTYTSSTSVGSGTGCFYSTMSTTRTFVFGTTGGSTTNAPTLYLVSGASIATITTGSWFNELNLGSCSFTIAATNLNLNSLQTPNFTGVHTNLTATMVGTGNIYLNGAKSIGPLVINSTSGTTTVQGGSTLLCTTCTLTSGTLDLSTSATLTCSSTFTWTSGSLINIGALNCTTFTLNGPTFNFTGGNIYPSVSFVVTSGSFTVNGGGLGAVPTFTHTAGTVQFNYNYSLTATGTYTFTAGTLSINDGITLSTGIFSSTNANSRTINFGITSSPGYIALTHTTAATVVLSMAIVTGLTVNALGKWDQTQPAQVYVPQQVAGGFRSETTVTRTFTCGTTGGNSTNAPCLYVTGTGATQLPTFTTGSWFGDFRLDGLSAMTLGVSTLNINTLFSQGYFQTLITNSLSLNFVGSGFCRNDGDGITTTYGTLGTVTINSVSGTTSLTYGACVATTVVFTSGTLECKYWVNGGYNGYSQFWATGTFTQTGGTWYNNAVYINNCTTYTINGATVSFNSGTVTATTSFVSTSGSFTFNGGTLSAVPTFTHTNGTVIFNYNYSLTTTGTYTLTAGTLTLAPSVTLNTGIFSSTGAGTRSIGFGSSPATPSGSVYMLNSPSFQYLSVPSNAALGFGTGDFTFECWTSLSGIPVATPFIAGQSSSGFCFWYDNGMVYGSASLRVSTTGGSNLLAANWNPNLNQWYHLAVSRSGTTLRLFINGTEAATATDSTDFSTSDVTIGANPIGMFAPVLWSMTGAISNLRIVKGVAVYTSTFTPSTLPLTATQSANTNGNPSAAITGAQTSLLLNTSYGSSFLTDSSSYGFTVTNNNGATNLRQNPFNGNINLTHTTAATVVLNMAALGGFSWTGSGGFTVADMANTRTFSVGNTSGGSITVAPNLAFTTGASIATLTTAGWFNNLDFGTTSFAIAATALNIAGDLTLSSGGTYTNLTATMLDTGTATLTSNGKTLAVLTINGPSGTFTFADAASVTGTLTLTAGSVSSVYNIASASFASLGPYARSITGTNTTYTISGAGATAWNFSSTGSVLLNGSTQSLSVPSNASFQFGTDDWTIETWFYLNSTTFGVIIDMRNGVTLNVGPMITVSTSLAYNVANTDRIVGSTTLSTGVWYHVAVVKSSGSTNMYLNGVQEGSTYTDSNTYIINSPVIGKYSGASASGYLSGYLSNFRIVKAVAVYTGNFTTPTKPLLPTQSAGTNISAITGSQTSLLLSTPFTSFLTDYSNNNFTVTNTGTATANTLSPFAVASPGITFTGFTINMTNAAAKTFAGSGATYPVLNNGGAGALTISGSNNFDTISNSVQPTTFTFTINTTQTVNNFNVAGIAGSLVTINSSTAATAATLSKASGTVYGSYLSIRDSTATGGATWYAGPTSTNVSNNTGWIFTRLPIVTFGNLTVADGGFTVSDAPVVF